MQPAYDAGRPGKAKYTNLLRTRVCFGHDGGQTPAMSGRDGALGVGDVERSDRLGDADLAVEPRCVAQRLRLVDPLPREVVVVAAEMPVCRGLRKDRTPQVEV